MQKNKSNVAVIFFCTHAYLFLSDEGSCFLFSIQNNCCEFLASYGIIQSAIQSYFLTNLKSAYQFGLSVYLFTLFILNSALRQFILNVMFNNFYDDKHNIVLHQKD